MEPLLYLAMGLGVGLGAFSWFSVLALLAHRGRAVLKKRKRIVARIIGTVLVVLGLLSVFRGAHTLWW